MLWGQAKSFFGPLWSVVLLIAPNEFPEAGGSRGTSLEYLGVPVYTDRHTERSQSRAARQTSELGTEGRSGWMTC